MAYEIDENLYNPEDYSVQYIGFKLPFSFGSPSDTMNDDTMDNIADNLDFLFQTEPGDRLFHPELGINFKKHLFNQMDLDMDTFQASIPEDVEQQVGRWMPFLGVDKVQVTSNDDRNTYNIKVDFHLLRNPSLNRSVVVNINGGTY